MTISHKNLFRQPFFWTSVCSLLALGILIGLYSYAWVAPTGNPNSSAGAAINFNGGNVGIGTTTPVNKLQVENDLNTSAENWILALQNNNVEANTPTAGILFDVGDVGSKKGGILYQRNSSYGRGDIYFLNNNVADGSSPTIAANAAMVIKNSGNVGIGTATPTYQLQLSTDSAAKPTSNTWTIASDERIKTDIKDFTDGLSTLLAIKPRTYVYNGAGGLGFNDTATHIGIIAQELEPVAPYMVETGKGMINGVEVNDFEYYQGHALPFIIVNAIKEQQKQIEDLKSELGELKTQLNLGQ